MAVTQEQTYEEEETLTMKVVNRYDIQQKLDHLGGHHVYCLSMIDDSEQYIIVDNSNLYLFQSPMLLN